MSTLSATEARANLYRVIDETAQSHEPVLITSKRNNAVLISERDWNSIHIKFLLPMKNQLILMEHTLDELIFTIVELITVTPAYFSRRAIRFCPNPEAGSNNHPQAPRHLGLDTNRLVRAFWPSSHSQDRDRLQL